MNTNQIIKQQDRQWNAIVKKIRAGGDYNLKQARETYDNARKQSAHKAISQAVEEAKEEFKNQIIEDIILGRPDHLPTYILDHPDGRIRKAYKRLMEPIDFSSKGIDKLTK